MSKPAAARLKETYGTAKAYAQASTALCYDMYDRLSDQAKRDIRQGYTAVARMPIDEYENWVAFHNEPRPLHAKKIPGKKNPGKTRGNFSRGALLVKGYDANDAAFSHDASVVVSRGVPALTENSKEAHFRAWLDKVEPKWVGASLTLHKPLLDLAKY